MQAGRRDREVGGAQHLAVMPVARQPARVTEISIGQEVSVFGRLDVNTVPEVRLALHDILDRGTGDLLLHLAQSEVHDATGLGVIVGVHHRARRMGRRLVLADVSPRLDRLLRASRLNRVLARGPDAGSVTEVPLAQTALPFTDALIPFTDEAVPVIDASAPTNETVLPFTD